MIHPDVVLRDILPGLRFGLGNGQADVSRHALRKTLRQACLCPLTAAPVGTVFQALIERSQRKIQQHRESQFVLEEIVEHMGRRIVAAEGFVERQDWAEVEVQLLAEFAIDLVHMAVELFQQPLIAVEHGIERGRIAGEVNPDEIFKLSAAPSSGRQYSLTWSNPRSIRVRCGSPYLAASSRSILAAESLIHGISGPTEAWPAAAVEEFCIPASCDSASDAVNRAAKNKESKLTQRMMYLSRESGRDSINIP